MRKGKVLILNRSGFLNYIYKNRSLLILTAFYIIGLVLGVFLISQNNTTFNLSQYLFNKYIITRMNASFISVFINSFLSMLVFVFIMFLSGTSFVGVVLSPIFISVLGYINGAFSSYIYIQNSIKGIAFNAVIIVPTLIFFLIGVVLSAQESLNFSCELVKLTFYKSHSSSGIFENFKNYCTKYLLLLLLPIASSLIDGIFSVTFIKYFNF